MSIKTLASSRAALIAGAVLALGAVAIPASAFAATNWTVDASAGGTCADPDFTCNTIQAAIDAAADGDTINVVAGTYDSFKIVGRSNLTITGAGAANTFVTPTSLVNTGVGHKYTANMTASVFVNGSTNVILQGMDVQDNGQAPGMGGPDALVFWNASTGHITNAKVEGTYAINGNQTGQGIAVDAGTGETADLTVSNTDISGYQKNGIDIVDGNFGSSTGDTVTVTVQGGSITGAGSTGVIAQNGVLAWNKGGGSVTASVSGTAVSDMSYSGPSASDTAILAYGTATISPISNVQFSNVDLYIDTEPGSGPIDATSGNTFDGVSASSATGAQLGAIEDKLGDVMSDNTLQPIYILPNILIATPNNLGINAGLVTASSTGDTVLATEGTYSGNVVVPTSDGLTLKALGSVTLNLGTGYGISLDNGSGAQATNFTFSGFTVNASSGTSYAFKAYKADGLTLTDDTFDGTAGKNSTSKTGGVDINTTSNVTFNNVTSNNFWKNGFADTAAYTAADSATSGNDVTFNGVTASNDGYAGIAFYAIGGSGGAASITGIHFTGANTISNNTKGIEVGGDTDANEGAGLAPAYTATTDGTTLDLSNVAFSGNSLDVVNYQAVDANAMTATFAGKTGSDMSSAERATEDSKIYDSNDNAFLGTVNYVAAPGCTFAFNPSTVSSGDSSTLSWGCVSVNAPVIITDSTGSTTTATSTGSMVVGIGTSGSYTYTLDTTENDASSTPIHESATLTVTSSSGGGSGGGSGGSGGGSTGGGSIGGGGSSNPLPGQTTTTTTTTTTTNPGQVLGAEAYNFTKDLWYHMKNNSDVAQLQTFLVAEHYSIPDAVTQFFGPETLAATKAFQKANGIPQTGYVGPLTRAVLNRGIISTTVETTH